MANRNLIGVISSALLVAVISTSLAQGTTADYQRAASVARDMAAKIFRSAVRPHWMDEYHFWYRNDLPEGKREFVLVDAAAPSRKPAFDSARLAAALTKL